MNLPALTRIRQLFAGDRIDDVGAELHRQLAASPVRVHAGQRVAVAVGSRGIVNLAEIVKALVEWVRAQGAEPFIIPAMGSHGGGTAAGQREVLESYGVTEDYVGAPIVSDMAVVELPRGDLPVKVYFDRSAGKADVTIAVNRIKPHTDYTGRYESGLMKMLAIGLGKHAQADAIHAYGASGLRDIMPKVAKQILAHANVVMGVAIVDNAFEQTMHLEAVPAELIPEREPDLLAMAREAMPRLPVDELDILIVDEMGKDISGTGLDTNIIGRKMIRGEAEFERPNVKAIIVRDLTDVSHGNAIGVGLADICTRHLFNKIDFKATYANLKTSTFLERGKIPVVAKNDREAAEFAVRTIGPAGSDEIRIVRIPDTLHLAHVYVSPAVLRLLKGNPEVDVTGPTREMFDSESDLCPFE